MGENVAWTIFGWLFIALGVLLGCKIERLLAVRGNNLAFDMVARGSLVEQAMMRDDIPCYDLSSLGERSV